MSGQQAQVGDETVLATENAMTDKKKFKNLVRERMARTGETYTTAKRNLERILKEGSSASPDVPSGLSGFEQRRREFRQRALSDWRKLTEPA